MGLPFRASVISLVPDDRHPTRATKFRSESRPVAARRQCAGGYKTSFRIPSADCKKMIVQLDGTQGLLRECICGVFKSSDTTQNTTADE